MHVDDVAGSSPFVKIINVLRDYCEPLTDLLLESRQSEVRRVRLNPEHSCASLIVEAQHEVGIGSETFGRRHLVNVVTLPQPSVITESGHAGLRGDSRTCQHNDSHTPIVDYSAESCGSGRVL